MDAVASSSPRVALVVEDDPAGRLAMMLLLKRWGWEAVGVESVADAIESVNSAPPACMFLDLLLPDGSGVDVLRHVRTRDLPIRIAITTATHDPTMLAEVDALHPDVLYRKPLDVPAMAQWLAAG